LDVAFHDLRDHTHDRHRTVDDEPYGGGAGMVMKPEPWFEAVESIRGDEPVRTVLFCPTGRVLTQAYAWELAEESRLLLMCGRYEGVDERVLRGRDTFSISSKHYAGDPYTYYLFTITPKQIGRTERIIRKIRDAGLKVHMQLLSNDEGVSGFSWKPEELTAIRAEMDAMLDAYPETVISSKYYHEIITTGTMLGRRFGWMECPSVTQPLDKRDPAPKHLTNFIRWASDLKTMHRCCTSETRDCSTCKDGAAHMSWVMVNKRAHMGSAQDLKNWIEVYEMFAKLYKFLPW
jgi:hypothetical protein